MARCSHGGLAGGVRYLPELVAPWHCCPATAPALASPGAGCSHRGVATEAARACAGAAAEAGAARAAVLPQPAPGARPCTHQVRRWPHTSLHAHRHASWLRALHPAGRRDAERHAGARQPASRRRLPPQLPRRSPAPSAGLCQPRHSRQTTAAMAARKRCCRGPPPSGAESSRRPTPRSTQRPRPQTRPACRQPSGATPSSPPGRAASRRPACVPSPVEIPAASPQPAPGLRLRRAWP